MTVKNMLVQYVEAVGLAWGADTMPVKQKHDRNGWEKVLRIINLGEGNGKPPRLKFSLNIASERDLLCHKPAVMAEYCSWVDSEKIGLTKPLLP